MSPSLHDPVPRSLRRSFSPPEAVPPGVRLVEVRADAWRVLDGRGLALGQLLVRPGAGGIRYHARRFAPALQAFREVGAFWSAAEAIECLRSSR